MTLYSEKHLKLVRAYIDTWHIARKKMTSNIIPPSAEFSAHEKALDRLRVYLDVNGARMTEPQYRKKRRNEKEEVF